MKFEPCTLTATQEKLWDDTRTALMWNCPAFTHIIYTMLDNAGSKQIAMFTKAVEIAATDGSNLLLNPDTFFKYNMKERVFIVAHEIMHCVWNHCGLMHGFIKRGKVSYPDGTELPYDQETMNIATDLVINDCLIESKIGMFNKDWLHDKDQAISTDSAIDAYKKVYKQQQQGGGGGRKGFDQHLAPGTSQGKDPSNAASQRNEIEWQTQIAAAANSARAQGKLPAGLERLLGEMLNPQVDWKDKIRSEITRKIGTGTYDWGTPENEFIVRDIYAPARSGFGAGTVVVAVDTSGSVGDKEIAMFFAEMSGILEDVRPRQMVIMWCDAAVDRVDEVDEAGDLAKIRKKPLPGGGGTDFRPVFAKIDELGLQPETLVYLTDGLGSFPANAPSYPTIWGSIFKHSKYPFGNVVDIPKQAVA